MSRSHSQSPTLKERHREDEEDRASIASGGSRAGSVVDLMFERLDALQSTIQSQVSTIQSQVGSLRSDVQSQVGSMQSQVGAVRLSFESQVGEVVKPFERLEASHTGEVAVGQDLNPDCSIGAAVGAD